MKTATRLNLTPYQKSFVEARQGGVTTPEQFTELHALFVQGTGVQVSQTDFLGLIASRRHIGADRLGDLKRQLLPGDNENGKSKIPKSK